jgi:pimeloyl-ACP methyl ester carboxylesterase
VRTALCPLAGDVLTEAFDFEQLGSWSVTGLSRDAAGNDRPTLWAQQSDGSFVPQLMRLPTGSPGGIAWAVDSLGQVVGEVSVGGERRSAYWLIPSFAPTVFPLAGGSAAFAIAGSSSDPVTAGQHQGKFALWYPKRTQNSVSYPLGETPSVAYRLASSSGVLTAVGQLAVAGGTRGFLWRSDTGLTELPTLGGNEGAARSFHLSSGRIVGFSAALGGEQRAVLWEGGRPWDLNELILPTCREGSESLCTPWHLESAASIGDEGAIVGTGTLDGVRHAFLAKPVELLTWGMATCAETAQPLCVADPLQTSQELIIDPRRIESSTSLSSSAAEPYAAAAKAHKANDGIAVSNAAAKFRAYAVFEHGTVIANLPPGQTQLEVRFHFQVDHRASTMNRETLASVDANVALRPSRGAGEYASASGSVDVGNGTVSRHGFLAGQGFGAGKVSLPLQLRPFATDGLEVRIEGRADASALASGSPTFAEGEVSVFFCAEDPRSITLPDGTPLAELGIKYTLWPTVRGDDRCQNPLEEQATTSVSCPAGVTPPSSSSLRVAAPPGILPGESVEIQAIAVPAGGTISATVPSGNATVERAGPCTTYPDGNARCPVRVRAAQTLPAEGVVVVRLSYTHPGGCRADRNVTLLASRLELVDPIVGDAPRLLDPATPLTAQPAEFIRRDPALLARMGRRVRGLAADGVTPVLLRFRAPGAGTVTFTLTDDRGSRDAARAGRLAELLGQPAAAANPVTVPVQQVGDEHWAFAVLTAPLDFIRPTVPGDASLGQARPRILEITGQFAPAGGGAGLTVTRKADLVRPPVVLIHGVWSEAKSWSWPLQRDDRFFVYPHDYKPHAGRSFLENQSQAYWGITNALKEFRRRGLAATQADVFGHSMGAILSRIYAGGRTYAQSRGVPSAVARAREFREPFNFGAGTIHKLVLVDSPQLGSPHANFLIDHPSLMWLFSWYEPRVLDGAAADLRRGGVAIQALPPVALPVHAMVGQGGGDYIRDVVISSGGTTLPGTAGWVGKLLALFGPNVVGQLFAPEPDHDVIVGICSQRAGLPPGSAAAVVTPDPRQSMHTNNTSSAAYSQTAVNLLNLPSSDPAFAAGLLPPASPLALCTPQTVPLVAMADVGLESHSDATLAGVEVVAGGLVVSIPEPGTIVTAGSTFPVSVAGAAGFIPARIFLGYGPAAVAVDGASFSGVLDVPEEAAGDIELLITAEDAAGRVAAAAPIALHVDVPADLTGLTVPAEPVLLSATTPSAAIPVTGTFDDGLERDVSESSAGTIYLSADPAVATVDADGTITAVKAGSTIVHVTNGPAATLVEVKVLTTPGDFDGDGTVGLADFLELRTCWTGAGEEQGFQAPPNACRDTFDSNGDGDVDRDDYDSFLTRYEGAQVDCNANTQPDLTDILDGVSADANGNGVPDECEGS